MSTEQKAGAAQEFDALALRIAYDVTTFVEDDDYIVEFARRLRRAWTEEKVQAVDSKTLLARLDIRGRTVVAQPIECTEPADKDCANAAVLIRAQVEEIASLKHQLERRNMTDEQLMSDQNKEIARLREWKEAILGAVKEIPEYEIGKWGGDKEGWGYCFEVVHHVRRELDRLREQIAAAARQEPSAWIEHHKGGDNLQWECQDHPNAKATPLYSAPVPVAGQEPVAWMDSAGAVISRNVNDFREGVVIRALYAAPVPAIPREPCRAYTYASGVDPPEQRWACPECGEVTDTDRCPKGRSNATVASICAPVPAGDVLLSVDGKTYASPSVSELASGVPIPVANLKELSTIPAGDAVSVQQDAERYRWLRNNETWPCIFNGPFEVEPLSDKYLDATVDAAIVMGKK